MEQKSLTLQEMFNKNTHLVYKIYHDRIATSNEQSYTKEDLIQVGLFTLWKCCRRYDESRGNKFSTYACAAIYKSMLSYLAEEHKHTGQCSSTEFVIACSEDGYELSIMDTIAEKGDLQELVSVQDCLQSTLSEMGEKCSLIACMLIHGYSQADIARKLGVTRTAVSISVKRIREALRQKLFGEEDNVRRD